jgi:hypothetical protein
MTTPWRSVQDAEKANETVAWQALPCRLSGGRVGERVEVHATNSIGRRLHEVNLGKLQIASGETIRQIIEDASNAAQGGRFSLHFLMTEWEQVVDGWQLDTWEAYRDLSRLGRKTRLKEPQRTRCGRSLRM